MGVNQWAKRRNARVVEHAPRRSRVALVVGAAIWGALAALFVYLAIADGGGSGGLGGFAVPILLTAALSAWLLWRAMRFRIARDAAEADGSLTLTGPRWSVTLRPGDVRQVMQLHRNPLGSGIYNVDNRAWGTWFRVDASTGGGRVRRYVVWRPDAPAFLKQLRKAGFPVVGEVAPVPEPS